jgi:uncharacterized protein (TIGR00730 family)
MLQKIKTITVYAASSSQIFPIYFDAASELGKQLATYSVTCINGGGPNGLMGAVTDAVLENGGSVCGVIPQFMVDEGWLHPLIRDLIITPDMHTRKQTMAQKSDACIALPGGVGTLEELLEIITWKQLGLYMKPIIILNIGSYYDDLLAMLAKADRENFIHSKLTNAWQVATTPQEALDLIFNQQQPEENFRAWAAL